MVRPLVSDHMSIQPLLNGLSTPLCCVCVDVGSCLVLSEDPGSSVSHQGSLLTWAHHPSTCGSIENCCPVPSEDPGSVASHQGNLLTWAHQPLAGQPAKRKSNNVEVIAPTPAGMSGTQNTDQPHPHGETHKEEGVSGQDTQVPKHTPPLTRFFQLLAAAQKAPPGDSHPSATLERPEGSPEAAPPPLPPAPTPPLEEGAVREGGTGGAPPPAKRTRLRRGGSRGGRPRSPQPPLPPQGASSATTPTTTGGGAGERGDRTLHLVRDERPSTLRQGSRPGSHAPIPPPPHPGAPTLSELQTILAAIQGTLHTE